jgi:hypothetical protein
VNCEEEMREKNEMGEGGYMCVVGEKKKERQGGYMGGGEKKKGKKKWGVGFRCMVGENGEWKRKKKKKNLKGKKLNWFYLYVHFVWCKV